MRLGAIPVWPSLCTALSIVVAAFIGGTQAQPLDASCVVSALNRTAVVDGNGIWVIPNVPANMGQIRVRATCTSNGVTRSGQSDLITVPVNGVVRVPEISFDEPVPVPDHLEPLGSGFSTFCARRNDSSHDHGPLPRWKRRGCLGGH